MAINQQKNLSKPGTMLLTEVWEMKLDISKLSEYDLNNAKAGDKVIIGYNEYSDLWCFQEVTIKSVSSKRGDITLSNGSKYRKDGKKMGVGRWDFHFSDDFFEYTQGNIKAINSYMATKNKANKIIKWFGELEKQGFKMLYDLPEDKISVLHKTLQEIFGAEND
jgi:hypothetical protein